METHAEGLDDVLGERSRPAAPANRPGDAPGVRPIRKAADDTPTIRSPRDGSPPAEVSNEPPAFGRRSFDDAGGMHGDAAPDDLDVDAAVSDRNVDRDKKLRALGWEKYGEQLRERGGSEKERADGDDGDDDTV